MANNIIAPIPTPSVPVVDLNTGLMTPEWYDFFNRTKLSDLNDVSLTTPTNGQVLTWVAATKKWTPV